MQGRRCRWLAAMAMLGLPRARSGLVTRDRMFQRRPHGAPGTIVLPLPQPGRPPIGGEASSRRGSMS